MTLNALLFLLVFLIGLYFYARCSDPKYVYEGYTNQGTQQRCPNLLIQKGSKFYLYNSKLAQVPGVNPIEFDNLEDYTEFLDWQRSQNISCPVLYLQSSYDTQGNSVYKVRPSVSEPQGGIPPSTAAPIGVASQVPPTLETSLGSSDSLAYPNPTLLVDATHNDPPYNWKGYPAYDQSPYYIGTTTPLDMMNYTQEKAKVSADPMDPNWGGSAYTQSLIDKGYYKQNEVSIYIP
jgi:hypothetical protein